MYKGTPIKLTSDFPSETMKVVGWHIQSDERKSQPRVLYLAKLSFKNEGEIKIFSDQQKMRQFVPSRPILQKILRKFFRLKPSDTKH